AGNMTQARSGHTLSVLNNGKVLIAGGENCTSATSCTATQSAEMWDPVAGTFVALSAVLGYAQFNATAVTLHSGNVLIVGGFDGTNLVNHPVVYNPTTNAFNYTGGMITARYSATATLLNNGKVLVAGGSTCAPPGCPTTAAEIYDPVASTFTA